jgi:hypothetical protein
MTVSGQGSEHVTQFEVQMVANQRSGAPHSFRWCVLGFLSGMHLCSNQRLEAGSRMLAKCVLV